MWTINHCSLRDIMTLLLCSLDNTKDVCVTQSLVQNKDGNHLSIKCIPWKEWQIGTWGTYFCMISDVFKEMMKGLFVTLQRLASGYEPVTKWQGGGLTAFSIMCNHNRESYFSCRKYDARLLCNQFVLENLHVMFMASEEKVTLQHRVHVNIKL